MKEKVPVWITWFIIASFILFLFLFFREHYLLNLIQNYLFVLTNTLDLLGVDWQKQGKP
jgi:hypothetical protein